MSETDLKPRPTSGNSDVDDMVHLVCNYCWPVSGYTAFAICGADRSGKPEVPAEAVDCVVCLDMDDQPCQRCGD